ncbi:MAG: hypothetical protein IKK93_07345 [Campylobacter sp.]|nr:hypothetical protein [Campylobacter sp.]
MVEKSLKERIDDWSKIPDVSENIEIPAYSLLDTIKENYRDYKKDVDNIIIKGRNNDNNI